MKIVHFIPVYKPAWRFGGPVLSVSRLCEGLAKEGIQVRVVTTNAGLPDLHTDVQGVSTLDEGVEVIRYPVDDHGKIIRSKALIQALPGVLADSQLLHISAVWQPLGLPVQREALTQGIPVLHTLRGALSPYSLGRGWLKKMPYLYLMERPLLSKAAGLHVTSDQEAQELNWLCLRTPIYKLPNPIDLSQLRPDRNLRVNWRNRLGIPEETPLLLVCGRQHHKKGLDLLPTILETQKHLPWRLLIVGSDDDGSGIALLRLLQQKGLDNRIVIQPTMAAHELNCIYNAADLLLLPSRHENFGNVVVEALACGCAVLISDRTGVGRDLLSGAPKGFGGVLPREKESWRNWLGQWLIRPERAGLPAATWAKETYGQEAVTQQALKIYKLILQNSLRKQEFS